MKIVMVFMALMLLLPGVTAIDILLFEKDVADQILPFSCKDQFTGQPCDNAYSCTITAYFPNGTLFLNDTTLTNTGPGSYQTILSGLTVNGFYTYSGSCTNTTNAANSDDLQFRVTESGQVFSEGQGLASLGIILSVIALSFFFMFLGFKFSSNPKTLPLTLFFVVLGLFLVVYSLQLGLQYSVDILEYEGLSNVQSNVYIGVLWLLTFIVLISFILMTFGMVREFGKGKMMKNFGEGFDPITQTYQ